MPSYVEKKTDLMMSLLWSGLLEEAVRKALLLIPIARWFFAIKPVQDMILWLVEEYLAEPLFLALTRFGVFTSIDWQNAQIYRSYEVEAEKLIGLQDKEEWNKEDRRAFKDAARRLIRITLR